MGILYDRSLELLNAVLYAMLQVILVTSAVFAVFASERINTTQSQVSLVRPERVSLFHKLEIVRTLDINSFKSMLNDTHTVWLVNFYSPWCPHCLQFATEWEDVAKIYAKVESIQLGAVDCTTQNEICDREGVYSYPGIKMYHVPPKSKAAIDMSHDDNVYARHVAKWIEETLKENGMGPIINVGGINSSTSKHRGLIKLYKFGDPVEPLYNEKAMDTRIKRLKDAGSTVLLTLEDGFFMGTTMLTGERYEAAVTWVQTLAIAFPLKENRAAFALLLDLIRQQQTWSQKDWNAVLYKWKDSANAISYPTNLFASKENLSLCTTFTCGLWTLFHSLTVNADQLQPSKVLKAIRLVVEHFFGCEECRRHFLKASPDIIVKTLALADDDGSHVSQPSSWET
ncbi:protein disulfide-isomerase domain [Plasmopara halstedii]|uniref:Sulfhydryl oxidase n=1 Tax=Plasmopara halstedii TaxID=4781 RepID=A0A0P1B2U1_PLAHL|nr:protein disulfide-isomerase domain [Plasmopara halstedii]CEG48780.1 protein disulfide-isomerase domain [Plasmopara halstedii]|eukprot:XP_024585149.1 protein disulfide-isomerase domain [Plasmopara halstedii]